MKTTLLKWALKTLDRGMLPDRLVRQGIRRMCAKRLVDEAARSEQSHGRSFEESMRIGPIAPVPEKANEQHYEVPADFYQYCLGPHRKYSCGYWDETTRDLEQAEHNALRMTCKHAELKDGQDILELGCGWGSLTLWMAEHYPESRITAVSNSNSQRAFIESQLAARELHNVRVITCDMNEFDAEARFDRVVSVEMFEHMRNYEALLKRISKWLTPDGKLFVHIFCHQAFTYPFETEGAANWMGQHFFTGGIMPSENVFDHFPVHMAVSNQWRWNGQHYEKTANAWLKNMDQHRPDVMPILIATYGKKNAKMWFNRWRVFFMACAELWGYKQGNEWFVAHYLLEPVKQRTSQVEEESACVLQPA